MHLLHESPPHNMLSALIRYSWRTDATNRISLWRRLTLNAAAHCAYWAFTSLFFFNNRSCKMKIWRWMKWIYDFNQNTKLFESTFWLGSKEWKWLCEESAQMWADMWLWVGEKKREVLRFVLPTKPSIRSPDTLTHHCSPPTGVMKASFSVFTPVPWEKAATRCKVVYPL